MAERRPSPAHTLQSPPTSEATSSTTPAGISPVQAKTRNHVPRTRAGANWIGACLAVVMLVTLIIFMAQNMPPISIYFIGMNGRFPLAITLVVAAVGGAFLTLVLGGTRILQLRRITHCAHRTRRIE